MRTFINGLIIGLILGVRGYSEAGVLEEQAREAQPLQQGENLLSQASRTAKINPDGPAT